MSSLIRRSPPPSPSRLSSACGGDDEEMQSSSQKISNNNNNKSRRRNRRMRHDNNLMRLVAKGTGVVFVTLCVISQCFLIGKKVMQHKFPETSKRIASHPASKKIVAASRRVLQRHFPPLPKKKSFGENNNIIIEEEDLSESDDDDINNFADRHIRRFMQIANDPDCVNPEIDLSSDDDPYEAGRIFNKCRLLVLRNAYSTTFLDEYRSNFTTFMTGLKSGRISTQGTTTTGDEFFYAARGRGRWEIILPEHLAHPNLVANEKILEVLTQPRVLGRDIELRSLQSTNAEGGLGVGQPWHYDQNFLFGTGGESMDNFGIAGHDIPTFAVTVGIPMMDMHREYGPTEFCIGSSAVNGLSYEPRVKDISLTSEGSLWDQYVEAGDTSCPPNLWRSPLLNFGDVVLFDYNLRHRGGWNDSPYMRSILLAIYSRTWFDDVNFGGTHRQSSYDENERASNILYRSRLARPDYGLDEETTNEEEGMELKDIKDFHPVDTGLMDFEVNRDKVEFIVSNLDVDGISGDDVVLYLNENIVGSLPPGRSEVVMGSFGDVMELRSRNRVVGKFIAKFSGQVVFTKDAMML